MGLCSLEPSGETNEGITLRSNIFLPRLTLMSNSFDGFLITVPTNSDHFDILFSLIAIITSFFCNFAISAGEPFITLPILVPATGNPKKCSPQLRTIANIILNNGPAKTTKNL